MEKRRFTRTQFSAHGSILVDGKSIECTVLNLSLKGALVEVGVEGLVSVGTAVALSFTLADDSSTITAQGTCVHVEGHELGVRFSSTDLDSLTHLRRLLELNTADADSIDRELGFLVDE